MACGLDLNLSTKVVLSSAAKVQAARKESQRALTLREHQNALPFDRMSSHPSKKTERRFLEEVCGYHAKHKMLIKLLLKIFREMNYVTQLFEHGLHLSKFP